jgi:uncharacterized membrane protein YesL
MLLLGKMADLLWLNVLTMLCCIPLVTIGASMTALHYMSLKIVRNEECYITRGYFKSFKENFRQSTVIWLLLFLVIGILAGDFYIMRNTELEFHIAIQVIISAVGILVLFAAMYLFAVQAKFQNKITQTIKNAFVISILQFPKTLLMIVLWVLPLAVLLVSDRLIPIVFFFGLSLPAYLSAMLYSKFFKKLEDQVLMAADPQEGDQGWNQEEDEKIFKDELDL